MTNESLYFSSRPERVTLSLFYSDRPRWLFCKSRKDLSDPSVELCRRCGLYCMEKKADYVFSVVQTNRTEVYKSLCVDIASKKLSLEEEIILILETLSKEGLLA